MRGSYRGWAARCVAAACVAGLLLAGCASDQDRCEALRKELIEAKERRNVNLSKAAQAENEGRDPSGYRAVADDYSAKVQETARKCRGIPGCNIDDLVGPMVGK